MGNLYTVHALVSVSASFIAIFIPIFLLKLGYTVEQLIILYFFTGVFKLVLSPVSFYCISTIGYNRTMAVGLVGQILGFIALITLPEYGWPLLLISLTKGIHGIFYYPAFNASMAATRAINKTGKTIGTMNVIGIVTGVVVPALGGYLATYYGINWLYAIAIALFASATILLLVMRESLSPAFSIRNIPFAKTKKDYGANFAQNFSGLSDIFAWTLLVFFIIPTYVGVGVLASISALTSLLITIYISRNKNDLKEKKFISAGSYLALIATLLRLLVSTPLHVVGVNLLSGVSAIFISNAYVGRYIKNSDVPNRLGYMFGMEASNSAAWLVFFGILYIASIFLSTSAVLALGVAIALPATLAIKRIR